jgi:hypothetical protein
VDRNRRAGPVDPVERLRNRKGKEGIIGHKRIEGMGTDQMCVRTETNVEGMFINRWAPDRV